MGAEVEEIDYFEVLAAARRLFDILASIAISADHLGMRADAGKLMLGNTAHIDHLYCVLTRYTGLTLPELEKTIAHLAHPPGQAN